MMFFFYAFENADLFRLVFNSQTRCGDHIRGYSAKGLILAQLSDYWTVVFDGTTPPEMAGDRFRITEFITIRANNEPN